MAGLLGLLALLVVTVWVARPLRGDTWASMPETATMGPGEARRRARSLRALVQATQQAEHVRRRDELLRSLAELEYDVRMHKVTKADYHSLRAALEAELKQLN